jgi:hypothetical protein
MEHPESGLQQSCVKWFRYQYSQYSQLLIAVPNGGARSKTEAAIMKGEGVTAGAADLLFLLPKGEYGALGIEMKIGTGKQTDLQKKWASAFAAAGNKYLICRSLEDFMSIINQYLN